MDGVVGGPIALSVNVCGMIMLLRALCLLDTVFGEEGTAMFESVI
jgi:hypothetical protein